jgi:peptide/nickel transport system ATP-binding protein
LIADEPTSALDNVVQLGVLNLVKSLNNSFQLAVLLITHNPTLLSGFADRVLVMYAGQIVEVGDLERIYGSPGHPYTRELLNSIPQMLGAVPRSKRFPLPVIAGSPPDLSNPSSGCCFEPRCPDRLDLCAKTQPPHVQTDNGGWVRCFRYGC